MKNLCLVFLFGGALSAQILPGIFSGNPPASGGSGPYALVQHAATISGTSTATSQATTFGSNNVAGHLLIVSVGSFTAAGPATVTVSDTAGNTYSLAITRLEAGPFFRESIFYVCNAIAGANVVTATNSSGTSELRVGVSEWSGNATAGCLDKTAGADNITVDPTTPSVTPTTSGQLIFGAAMDGNAVPTPAGSYISLNNTTGTESYNTMYQIQAVAASIAGTWTCINGRWDAIIATFK